MIKVGDMLEITFSDSYVDIRLVLSEGVWIDRRGNPIWFKCISDDMLEWNVLRSRMSYTSKYRIL